MRGLRLEFPLFGRAAEMMMNPMTAAVALAVGAFGYLKSKIDEVNQKLAEVSAAAAEPVKAHRDLAGEARANATAHGELAREMAAAQTASGGLVQGLSEELTALRRVQQAQAAVDNAQKGNEIARVHFQMAQREADPTGRAGISAQAGAAQIAAIEEKYADLERQRKEESAKAMEAAAKEKAQQVNRQRGPLSAALQEANRRRDAAGNELAEADRGKAALERTGPDNKSKAERDAAAAQDTAEQEAAQWQPGSWRAVLNDFGLHYDHGAFVASGQKTAEELRQKQTGTANASRETGQFATRMERALKAKEAADTGLTDAKGNWKAWQGDVEKVTDDFSDKAADRGQVQRENALVRPIEASTRRLERGTRAAQTLAQQDTEAQRQASEMIRSGGNPQMNSAIANEFRAYQGEMMAGNAELLRALADARREAASARAEATRMRGQMTHLANSQ